MWLFMCRGTDEEQAQPRRDRRVVVDGHGKPLVVERMERGGDHRYGLVEPGQDLVDGRMSGIGKFPFALANVAAALDRGANIVVEVARQVKHQVADAVAEGKRLFPERFGGNRADSPVNSLGHVLEVASELKGGQASEVGSRRGSGHGPVPGCLGVCGDRSVRNSGCRLKGLDGPCLADGAGVFGELVFKRVAQGQPACLDDVLGDADGSPDGGVVAALDDDAHTGRRAGAGVDDPDLVVDQVISPSRG